MPPPKISIFTCSHNNPGHIAVVISSVLRQTFPDFEYFILENSTDGITRGIIHEFNDPRIKIIEAEAQDEYYLKNKYLPQARGKPRTRELTPGALGQFASRFIPFISGFTYGAFRVRGKYIMFLSDNDILMTDCFQEHLNAFEMNKSRIHDTVGVFEKSTSWNTGTNPRSSEGGTVVRDKNAKVFYHAIEVIYTYGNHPWYQIPAKQIFGRGLNPDGKVDIGAIMFERSLMDNIPHPFFGTDETFVNHLSQMTDIYPLEPALHIKRMTADKR